MSRLAADAKELCEWADKSCTLLIDANQALKHLSRALLKPKRPDSQSELYGLPGMADAPGRLHLATVAMSEHLQTFSDDYWNIIDLLQGEFPQFLQPIQTSEFYCLTAIEASHHWLTDLCFICANSMLWRPLDVPLHESVPPNWKTVCLAKDELTSYQRAFSRAVISARNMNANRSQWLRTSVEREAIMIDNLILQLGDVQLGNVASNGETVTVAGVAKILHISRSSIATQTVAEWGEPVIKARGRRPAQFDLKSILPVLREQYPEADL